jgi:hypothetical protein
MLNIWVYFSLFVVAPGKQCTLADPGIAPFPQEAFDDFASMYRDSSKGSRRTREAPRG